jgi:hypothetical protein
MSYLNDESTDKLPDYSEVKNNEFEYDDYEEKYISENTNKTNVFDSNQNFPINENL